MSRFALRMADFILSRASSLSAARPIHCESRAGEANGRRPAAARFIKADGRFIKAGQLQWPFFRKVEGQASGRNGLCVTKS